MTMERSQIREALAVSNRWGVNDKPYLGDVVDVLAQLPIASLRMKDEATLVVRFARPLKAWEAWNLLLTLASARTNKMRRGPVMEAKFWW